MSKLSKNKPQRHSQSIGNQYQHMNTNIRSSILLYCTALAALFFATANSQAQQRSANATATQTGHDGGNHPVSTTLSILHNTQVTAPKVAMRQTGVAGLQKNRLTVSIVGTPFPESFRLITVTSTSAQVGAEPQTRFFHNTSAQSGWVLNNIASIFTATVNTTSSGAVLVADAPLPANAVHQGGTFLARIENNDSSVVTQISGSDDDLQGVRLALEDAVNVLADDIDRRVGSNFIVSRAPVNFSPHDDGRKAIVYILTLAVKKPNWAQIPVRVATIYVPVSFVFRRNTTNNGYIVSVNPTDITNKDRLLASAKLVLDEVADVMNAHKD
ncbi:MAG: hypothetical protein B7Z37_20500 [Verrucomicrobia bacterium 12-59-8]|nr:MAG: hypothetical protein B7Z37_20500 [Verrucomicrobia bacterium 12-59-8]